MDKLGLDATSLEQSKRLLKLGLNPETAGRIYLSICYLRP